MNHIEINVSNLQKTKAIYADLLCLLGWEIYQEWTLGFSYQKNGLYLVFVQAEDSHKESGYHRKRIGLNHLAFNVASIEQFEHAIQLLEAKKVQFLYKNRFPYAGGDAMKRCFFEDFDRIKIELVLVNSEVSL